MAGTAYPTRRRTISRSRHAVGDAHRTGPRPGKLVDGEASQDAGRTAPLGLSRIGSAWARQQTGRLHVGEIVRPARARVHHDAVQRVTARPGRKLFGKVYDAGHLGPVLLLAADHVYSVRHGAVPTVRAVNWPG